MATTGPNITLGNRAWAGAGYGIPIQNAGAPTNGVAGTRAGANSGPGARLIDTVNAFYYINTNTALSPTWVKVGTQS